MRYVQGRKPGSMLALMATEGWRNAAACSTKQARKMSVRTGLRFNPRGTMVNKYTIEEGIFTDNCIPIIAP
jgi:hypothetical protein